MKKPEMSVIISTYNAPKWLEKTLYGFSIQSFRDFEIVIADDGSKQETRDLIEQFSAETEIPVVHVWHEDNGFQKSQILNKAILKCSSKYIVMTDGDCIPRKDFMQVHFDRREPGYFLSGGYFMLPMDISEKIDKEDIEMQRCFEKSWLQKNGLKSVIKTMKLTSEGRKADFLNKITPTSPTWNGHNASGWTSDILKVNGFDERMQYGGQDRELGERLVNSGIKGKQIRYSAICVHLDHPRGYKTQESIDYNRSIRKNTRDSKSTYTKFGINKS